MVTYIRNGVLPAYSATITTHPLTRARALALFADSSFFFFLGYSNWSYETSSSAGKDKRQASLIITAACPFYRRFAFHLTAIATNR